MPVSQTVWKTTFYRNTDEKGGAMVAAISGAKPEHIILHSHTRKNGRIWGSTTPDALLKLIENNKGIYEVIHNFPHKVYFDIDKKNDDTINHEEFIKDVRNIILEVFTDAAMNISGSITDTKISYHIVLENYAIHNEDERQKMKYIVKAMNAKCDAFDWKVYTKNRNMKCINQSKEDGRVQEILYDSSRDFKKHLITCFLPLYPETFPSLNEETQLQVEVEKSKGVFNMANMPKLVLPVPENFDFYDESITPLQILSLLPLNEKDFDHSYTHLVARFCFYNELSFEQFVSWYSKKSSRQSDIQKWKIHWDNLSKFPNVSQNRIKQILEYYYPHIKKDIHYRKFADSFFFNRTSNSKIECITDKCYTTPHKFAIFNVGMGGGKTFKTIQNLHAYHKICWIAPTKSLANNTYQRLNEAGLGFKHYEHFNAKQKHAGELNNIARIIICQHSLHYCFTQKYDCIVIDEIETVLNNWYGEFINARGNKLASWKHFLRIIQSAQKVILLDAFITKKTIDFCAESPIIFERINEPMTRTITYCEKFEEQVLAAISDLKKGMKLFIFYPYKNKSRDYPSMETLFNMLQTESKTKGIYYNADIDDKIKDGIKDVNKSWGDAKFIISNNMITCGVNYESEDFDKEYLFVAKHNSPRDVIQFSYRPRHLRTNKINVCYLGKMLAEDTWTDDRKTVMNNDPVYNKLFENILCEKKSPMKKTFQLFASKAHYYQHTEKKHLISDSITKEFDELSEKYNYGFDYNSIELIDFSYAEVIQQKCLSLEATMWEKVALQKYFFNLKFKESAAAAVAIYEDSEIKILETSWNEKMSFFFDKLLIVIRNPNHLFNKLKEENGWETFFPEGNIHRIILSPDNKKVILDNFHFRRPVTEMKTSHLIKSAYNVFFNKFIIETSYDNTTSNHITFTCNFEWYNLFYTFAKEFMKGANSVIENDEPNTFDDAPDISSWFANEEVKEVILLPEIKQTLITDFCTSVEI